MAKITRLEQPPMVDFCGVCLDEPKCYDAGRCLFDAVTARDRAELDRQMSGVEPVEPVPIRPDPSGSD